MIKKYLAVLIVLLSPWLFQWSSLAQDQVEKSKVFAYQVKIVQKNGVAFDGVVLDRPLIAKFDKEKNLDLTQFNPSGIITLHYVHGLNGSMGLRVKDLKSVIAFLALTQSEVEDIKNSIEKRVEVSREEENKRIEELKAQRIDARKRAQELAKEREKQAEIDRQAKEKANEFNLLKRFPPEEGWIPEKKQELYLRGITVDVYPNEKEQEFLDNYDAWLVQYNAWVELKEKEAREQESVKKEEKKQSEGKKEGWHP